MKSYQLKTHKQQEVGEDLFSLLSHVEMEIKGITSSASSEKKKNHRQTLFSSCQTHFLLQRTFSIVKVHF